jgi:xanthine dehydrogenase YagS FAD-binding subunit
VRNFEYLRPSTLPDALAAAAGDAGARFLAGGTTLVDLMKCGVEAPARLVDITRLPGLDRVEVSPDGSLRVGALVSMNDLAGHPAVEKGFPAVAEALLRGASSQLRNMATIGGNLLQRTRCHYFRDPDAYPACNKRSPGSGCAAIGGENRDLAVLGTSARCIASYPGDLAVALVAFDAVVHVASNDGHGRAVPIDGFFLLPGDTPHLEHPLAPGELVTAVAVPASAAARRSRYLKVRDRESYEFAAASAAVGLELEADGRTVRDVRVALGNVGTKPWRARAVEAALIGGAFDEPTVRAAAKLATEGGVDHGQNGFKIALAPRVVARALLDVGGID